MMGAVVRSVIATRGLIKNFGHVCALDGLDLEVRAGEVHGFLGPNGAGKSTAIRILLGLLRADAGDVELLGGDPWHDATELHRRLAYVPGDVTLWSHLTGGEVIDLLGRMRGGLDGRRKDELIERFGLDPTKKGRTYSKGNRQKVALVAALAGDVELLLLDEPTAGLDPLMEATFRDCIEEARGQGRTVLLSSHLLGEVEALCERVSIIRNGRIVESGTLTELRHLTRTSVDAELVASPTGLEELPGIHDLRITGRRVRVQVDADALEGLMRHLADVGIVSIASHPPTLQELFLRHYEVDGEDGAGPGGGP
jgi:ABC-2 type transport system ATP-binding protein